MILKTNSNIKQSSEITNLKEYFGRFKDIGEIILDPKLTPYREYISAYLTHEEHRQIYHLGENDENS